MKGMRQAIGMLLLVMCMNALAVPATAQVEVVPVEPKPQPKPFDLKRMKENSSEVRKLSVSLGALFSSQTLQFTSSRQLRLLPCSFCFTH